MLGLVEGPKLTSTLPKEQIFPSAPKQDKNNESSKTMKKKQDKDKVDNTVYKSRINIDAKKIVKEPPPKELPMDYIRPFEEKKKLRLLIMMK